MTAQSLEGRTLTETRFGDFQNAREHSISLSKLKRTYAAHKWLTVNKES